MNIEVGLLIQNIEAACDKSGLSRKQVLQALLSLAATVVTGLGVERFLGLAAGAYGDMERIGKT